MTAPSRDCPPCPSCSCPCGTLNGESIPEGHLRCAACGHEWRASAAELVQARAADAAWELEQQQPAHVVASQLEVDRVAAEHAARQTDMWGQL
jgi:hypothetical protein